MPKRNLRLLEAVSAHFSVNSRQNIVNLSETTLNDLGKVFRGKWSNRCLRTARYFPMVIQKTLLNHVVSTAEWHRITKVEIGPGFNDGQVHVSVSRIRYDLLNLCDSKVAFGVFDLAGFEINDPVTLTLQNARKILFRKLISFRRNVIIN